MRKRLQAGTCGRSPRGRLDTDFILWVIYPDGRRHGQGSQGVRESGTKGVGWIIRERTASGAFRRARRTAEHVATGCVIGTSLR